ncbi:response regulator transcription factor [Sporomusa sp.]|jgi:DNA-binding response OmpR family regulator|uniref:response regulator transcription factor n=1 Tax=Sporomusa sp. TaxID=2078658 RepID=UPI002C685381|nr:response regulator transcription factor [Sporomusa sp.]MDF2874100.1 two component transcriptional regulator, winged helix family [Sporomusa sp.]HWR09070.1 response regulator transcription factor [Sporomusa sp.]
MTTEGRKILVVEDEWKIARFLQMELEHEGFQTAIETNGRRAFDRIMQEDFDLILLDLMLPEMDGVEVCRRVRELSEVPIIMVTARDDIEAKVTGLDSGANDYLTKPFAIPELFARIRAAFRKTNIVQQPTDDNRLCVKNLKLFPNRYEAQVDGQPVELTKKEYDLLDYLVHNKNLVLNRDRILQKVWGYEYTGDTNIVDVYIRYLRNKLDERFGQKYIYTIRGVGYVVKD